MALDVPKHTDDARYAVYLPRARERPLILVPLCMQPSLEAEQAHGPLVFVGTIDSRTVDAGLGESTRPDAVDAYASEVLVTDRECIRSIRTRTSPARDPEDAFLLRLS